MIIPKDTLFLVVDDAANLRQYTTNQLETLGFNKIVRAPDGVQAFKVILDRLGKTDQINFVLCDWHMPEMTGFELLTRVRATPELKELPFVLVTSEAEAPEVVKAIKAGASAYVLKPFDSRSLEAKLESAWKKHHKPKDV